VTADQDHEIVQGAQLPTIAMFLWSSDKSLPLRSAGHDPALVLHA
jgi:hypothetical protein